MTWRMDAEKLHGPFDIYRLRQAPSCGPHITLGSARFAERAIKAISTFGTLPVSQKLVSRLWTRPVQYTLRSLDSVKQRKFVESSQILNTLKVAIIPRTQKLHFDFSPYHARILLYTSHKSYQLILLSTHPDNRITDAPPPSPDPHQRLDFSVPALPDWSLPSAPDQFPCSAVVVSAFPSSR